MDLKIIEERPNPLLKRTEYRFEIGHDTASTPNRDSVRTELAKALKVPKDRVIIERMHAKYGVAKSVGEAATYQTKEAVDAVVREHILIRNGLREKKVKAVPGAAPAETPAPAPAAAPSAPAPSAPEKGA
ncbi:MAG TPA: 30S ribosomal protein S24e [Thermoplasmata archaeon]|nr:30S ribosomal protein S24e [Thermoplasmata archaeon]